MSELHDPPLRITVEGLRWMGEEWEIIEPGASIHFHNTASGDLKGGQLIRLMREAVYERVPLLLGLLVTTWESLDFDAPNPPTEDDLRQLVAQTERLREAFAVLKQLAPEVLPDDDESEPE
jgi:hypothetical protein